MRHTTVASRTIDSGFYRVGLPHVAVEADSHDKQIADAFRMQHRAGEVHADIIFTTPRGTRHVVSTATGGLQKIQSSRYTHMDEDAVGKGFHVRDNSDHPVGIRRFPEGRG